MLYSQSQRHRTLQKAGHFRQPISKPAQQSGSACRGCCLPRAVPLIACGALNAPESRAESSVSLTPWLPCPGPEKQRQSSQPSRFQSQYLLPGLQQQLGEKKNFSSRPSKSSSSCPGLPLGQMANATVLCLLSTKCFAGSQCSPRRYIPICQSKRQQSNRVFLNNMKVLYLEWNRVLLHREQRVRRRARALPREAGILVCCRCRADPRKHMPLNRTPKIPGTPPNRETSPKSHRCASLNFLFKSFPLWKSRRHRLLARASYTILL